MGGAASDGVAEAAGTGEGGIVGEEFVHAEATAAAAGKVEKTDLHSKQAVIDLIDRYE